jgi:hypothetical protein
LSATLPWRKFWESRNEADLKEVLTHHLIRWAMKKYKRLRGQTPAGMDWLNAVRQRQPSLFAH